MPAASERPLAHPVPKQHPVSLSEFTSRGPVLLLALVTLAGAWLRLFHLGDKSLWLDEGLSWIPSRMGHGAA